MLQQLQNWLEKEVPQYKKCTYLLAISGGVDSMTLMHLFEKLKLKYQVAHVNYQLRSTSDEDEEQVRQVCQQWGKPFHFQRVDTLSVKRNLKLSTQEVARQFRYTWFSELAEKLHLDYVVTAHHQNDHIETFFINLLRNTGLTGLIGISSLRGKVIRPLLEFTKEDLLDYAKYHKLRYSEDLTNYTNQYLRNRVRNQILPALNRVNPHALRLVTESIKTLREDHLLYEEMLTLWLEKITINTEPLVLDLQSLSEIKNSETLLFKIMQPYGMKISQCRSVFTAFHNHHSGKKFLTKRYEIILDRHTLRILPSNETYTHEQPIDILPCRVEFPDQVVDISLLPYSADQPVPPTDLYLDAATLRPPLTLRYFHSGDRFSPLGMSGRTQKVQDFLTNRKVSIDRKLKTLLLTNEKKVIAVIPYRIADEHKITAQTKKMVCIKWFSKQPEH